MLALIAGQGRLPAILAAQLARTGTRFQVYEMDGFPADPGPGINVTRFRIETLGTLLNSLQDQGFDKVCFAGSIRRPPVDAAKIDAATKPIASRLSEAISLGDDAALRVITGLFADKGLEIIAASDIAPELLPAPGSLAATSPDINHQSDAERASAVIAALGVLDLGQACVVAGGQVLALEALAGTDFMLQTLDRTGPASCALNNIPTGGILFKSAKPGQDMRVDMPTIGVDTITAAHRAGLNGIVIAAGQVLVLDLPDVIASCDRLGLFLWVRTQG